MYDEKSDIALHQAMFTGLTGKLASVGYKSQGFHLALDIGGGYGAAAPFLHEVCQKVYVSDIINYNEYEHGRLLPLLIEKYQRVGLHFDPSRLEFHFGDAQSLIYKNDIFDFIYSINAFEHIPQPDLAWAEIARVAMPGAVVALQFDPIWTSAFGHHLFDLPLDPWDHLVLEEHDFESKVLSVGGTERHVKTFRTEMNRKTFAEHVQIIEEAGSKYFASYHTDHWDRPNVMNADTGHPNFLKAVDMGFDPEHLIVRGFNFVGVVGGDGS